MNRNNLTIEEYMALNDFPDFGQQNDEEEKRYEEYVEDRWVMHEEIIGAAVPPEFNPNSYDYQCE